MRYYDFDNFRLDVKQQCLFREHRLIGDITPQLYSLLLLFVENEGQILDKEKLKEAWQENYYNEEKMGKAVRRLRKALEKNGGEKNYIETIQRRGYRFTAAVIVRSEEDAKPPTPPDDAGDSVTSGIENHLPDTAFQLTPFVGNLENELPSSPEVHENLPISSRRFLGGQVIFAITVSMVYGGWYAIAFAVELAYQFSAYRGTIFRLTPLIFLGMSATAFAGLAMNWKFSVRENFQGLLYSVAIFVCAAILLFICVSPFLPTVPVTLAKIQSQPAQAAFLKTLLYALPLAVFFLLIPFQFCVQMQQKLKQGRAADVVEVVTNKSLLRLSGSSFYIRRDALGFLLIIATVTTVVGMFQLFSNLIATRYMNLFQILYLIRVALWFGFALLCLGWYARMLNRLIYASQSSVAVTTANREASPHLAVSQPLTRRFTYLMLLIIGVVLSGVALLASTLYISPSKELTSVAADKEIVKPSILVLPLAALNLSKRHEYLAIGLTDMLLARLSRFRHLEVRSHSQQKASGQMPDALQIGRAANVQWILEGNIQTHTDRVRVTLKLLRVNDGATVWADTTDEQLHRLLALEEALGKKLHETIALQIPEQVVPDVTLAYTTNEAAYEDYLRARYFFSARSEKGLQQSIAAFQRAIEKDANFARAYVGLAEVYLYLGSAGYSSLPPQEVILKATEALQKAMKLDAGIGEVYSTLGYINWFYEWNWSAAIQQYETALKINPQDATAHQRYGLCLMTLGKLEEALQQMKLAHYAEPGSLIFKLWIAHILYYQGDYEQASERYRSIIDMDGNFYPAHLNLGMVYAQQNRFAEAQTAWQKAGQLYASPIIIAYSGYAYGLEGNRQAAEQRLNELRLLSQKQTISPYYFSIIHAGLGDKERAFAFLEDTLAEHSGHLSDIQVDPVFQFLHTDIRYKQLLQQMNLAP